MERNYTLNMAIVMYIGTDSIGRIWHSANVYSSGDFIYLLVAFIKSSCLDLCSKVFESTPFRCWLALFLCRPLKMYHSATNSDIDIYTIDQIKSNVDKIELMVVLC